MSAYRILIAIVLLSLISCNDESDISVKKHLFILSGQSNMAALKPEESFNLILNKEYGENGSIVVKDAWGGQPIRRWYKNWTPLTGSEPKASPDLYDSLMKKVRKATANIEIITTTFIWMQGERDAREGFGNVYERSLMGLYNQLSNDLNSTKVNFVIGRINDFDMNNNTYPDWTLIRKAQENVGESSRKFSWINTDDLNDGLDRNGNKITNNLHMSATGYVELGRRFADHAIVLINNN